MPTRPGPSPRFAFGQRHPVLDTNARRVLARVVAGAAGPGPAAPARDLALAEPLLPPEPARAARYAAALMEFGALVCTARAPRCGGCPLRTRCSWRLAGRPTAPGPARRQGYAGTDRQARGRLLAVLRTAPAPVEPAALAAEWNEPLQRARALDSLLDDGLVSVDDDGRFALPG